MTVDAAVLDPLLARYATWLSLSPSETADTSDENPDDVVLMPLVLRIERQSPPARTAMLEAAATAALAVCLDERAAPGGEWHAAVYGWTSGRIRKVARRARGAHWRAVQDLPGVTVSVGDAEVRALVPMRVSESPKELTRLQISGSDLDPDEPAEADPGLPVLWLNPDIPMSAGKAAAQVGHATMIMAALLHGGGAQEELQRWIADGARCSVRTPDPTVWRELAADSDPASAWRERGIAAVRDAGFTEVRPGTITVLAQWPRA